jgi:hypothetical protein
MIEQGNELMTAALPEVFQLAIEPTVCGDENRGFFPTRKLTKQGLIITELTGGKEKQHGCYHSPTAVDDTDLAEHAIVVPGAWSKLHDLSESLGDFIPAWFVDLGIGSRHFEGWLPRIIADGDKVLCAIGHERETLLSACWANDRFGDSAGGAKKCRALIGVFIQEQSPVAERCSSSPQ